MAHDLSEIQTRAVKRALRSFRAFRPPTLTQEDLWQEACLGVLAGTKVLDMQRPAYEQEAYLTRRALGAIQDACARAWRLRHVELDAMPVESRPADPLDIDSPEQLAVVNQALEAVARLPEPLPTLVRLTLSGSSGAHVASVLGVSEARVSQLRNQLARRLAKFLSMPARVPASSL